MSNRSIKHMLKLTTAVVPVVVLAMSPAAAKDRRVEVNPYIEAAQVLFADLKNGGDVVTYSTVAAGVDAAIRNSRAEAQVNVRYERRIGYDSNVSDEDIISGLARGRVDLVRNQVSVEAGGLATRSRVDVRGRAPSNLVGNTDNVTQVYSIYAGPTLRTNVGAFNFATSYRVGYTKVESDTSGPLAPGQLRQNSFDDSVNHSARASVGMRPGELPVGWTVSTGYDREDAGQLDSRLESKYARVDVTVPVSPTLALVGGAGYEDIEISERDAVRDVNGNPVVGTDGRLVTDQTSPRRLAYDQRGLIWDAGVLWRPSRRTSLEARVGRRYGTTSYSGSLSYQPNQRTAINVSVYDVVTGFGSQLNNNLAGLPTQFDSFRNPLTGDLAGCAFAQTGGACFGDALQSVASSNFRARGVTGQFSTTLNGWQTGLALGYAHRRFFSSQAGPLANVNGIADQNYFANAFVSKEIDAASSFSANVYANYLQSGFVGSPDVLGVGANAAYYRTIADGLVGTAAVGLDSFRRDGLDSSLNASALVGLRYNFGSSGRKKKKSRSKK